MACWIPFDQKRTFIWKACNYDNIPIIFALSCHDNAFGLLIFMLVLWRRMPSDGSIPRSGRTIQATPGSDQYARTHQHANPSDSEV